MKELLRRLWNEPATVRKLIVALVGAVVVAVSVGLVPGAVGDWVTVISAFLTAIGVYGLRNSPVEGLNVRFSADQVDKIRRATDIGDMDEAQRLVLSHVQEVSKR